MPPARNNASQYWGRFQHWYFDRHHLHINTFEILGSLFLEQIAHSLATPFGQIGGIAITGLAASAGSTF